MVQITCSQTPADIIDRLSAVFPELVFAAAGREMIRVEADGPIHVGPLVRFLEEAGGEVAEAKKIKPSLEDIFVRITGIEAAAMRGEKERKGGLR